MKRHLLASATALALTTAAGLAQAQIANGGFEDPIVNGGSGYNYRTGTTLTDWLSTTATGAVQFNTTYRPVSEGNQAVQLERNGDTLEQTFATLVGQAYLLTYDLSAYSGTSTLFTSVGNASHTVFGTSAGYTPQSLSFTASTTTTTLLFRNDGQTFISYPHIDNVQVTAVPEPETYAMMLAGLGVMGFLARRRGRQEG